jgi:predicted NAD/FAD-binding protein
MKNVIWSVSAREARGTPTRGGRVRFVRHFEGWVAPAIVVDPTWADVCKAAEASIEALDDKHHVFLEGVETIEMLPDGVIVVDLIMGS